VQPKILLPVLTVLALLAPSCTEAPENRAVRNVFESFHAALLVGDGGLAADCTSRLTMEYYERCATGARSATALELHLLPMAEKLMVLRIRHNIAQEALRDMDGRAAFVHSVSRRWLGQQDMLERAGIGGVTVKGDTAEARMTLDGAPTLQHMRFRHEAGEWRIDLRGMAEASGTALAREARELGITEEQHIGQILNGEADFPLPEDIWAPIHQ